MSIFDNFKDMNINELAEWLDEHCFFDNSPWFNWYDEKYCKNCKSIISSNNENCEMEFGYCEVHNNCMFFKNMNEIPDSKQIIKMWLMSEAK